VSGRGGPDCRLAGRTRLAPRCSRASSMSSADLRINAGKRTKKRIGRSQVRPARHLPSMLGLPPAAAPAPAAGVTIVPATPLAPPRFLGQRLGSGKIAEHLAAAHRRRQRRRRTGQAEARREHQCDHDRTHSILPGLKNWAADGPLSLGLQFNQEFRQDARPIFRGLQPYIHLLFRCVCPATRLGLLHLRSAVDQDDEGIGLGPGPLPVQYRCWTS
jgi:hypothetical protein